MEFSEDTIKKVWILVRNGATKQKLKSLLHCSDEDVEIVYNKAYEQFSRGPYKLKKRPEIKPAPEELEPQWERPPAEYTNAGYQSTLKKYS